MLLREELLLNVVLKKKSFSSFSFDFIAQVFLLEIYHFFRTNKEGFETFQSLLF
jgi:hypothetical protein